VSAGSVALRLAPPVAEVVLQRPQKLNALAGSMREQLAACIATAATTDGIRALVVTGAGSAFCAGGDIGTMTELHAGKDDAGFHRILHAGAECVLSLQAFPGITVAAINGVAAGAGLALALNCDVRVACPEAKMAASWSRIGLVPDWGATFWLPRLLGYANALQLTLANEAISARRALELGLITEIVGTRELLPRAHRLAADAIPNGDAVLHTRRLLRRGLTHGLEASLAAETEAQEERFASEEVAAALAAFARRGKPPVESS